MTDTMPARETGAATAGSCPTCGGPLQVLTSAYGSVSSRCPKCQGQATQTAAQAPTLPRETGTTVTAAATPTEEDDDDA